MENKQIDVTFDVRTDSIGKDPDSGSKTLKYYHKLLWSKYLPNGEFFDLDDSKANVYLHHKSDLGEYFLSSDSVIHSYSTWVRTKHIISQIPKEEVKYFHDLSYTIGGFLVFPGNRIDGLHTINQERGMNSYINDRIDLTLECIRLYYKNEKSPLFDTINRYNNFFSLFTDFKGYCEYFLMQDLVSDDFSKINFFLPFDCFIKNPLPKDIDEYNDYKKNNIDFLLRRNKRIQEYNKNIL